MASLLEALVYTMLQAKVPKLCGKNNKKSTILSLLKQPSPPYRINFK